MSRDKLRHAYVFIIAQIYVRSDTSGVFGTRTFTSITFCFLLLHPPWSSLNSLKINYTMEIFNISIVLWIHFNIKHCNFVKYTFWFKWFCKTYLESSIASSVISFSYSADDKLILTSPIIRVMNMYTNGCLNFIFKIILKIYEAWKAILMTFLI